MRSALGKSHKQKTENLDKVTRNTSKVSNPLKWYEKMLKKYIKVFSTSDKGFTSYLESSQASVICVQ